ncbi:hypothetical protein I302_101237 [Kwoniella bestiolae CBS 10118]|uniref:Short-chain dehydrogenase n=1 Tax=Kwoniella bestiolae CBS 10118 TaxID=1296100 RepID=A0A1B9G7B5_9TREE|nr:hypothetical protein I302_04609 [Kwoniella bestiolae CBS 10118]OCF26918.1 hypothetical protein I302_04609 [Kwoniella bestiolae CBS 10118]
MVAPAGLFSNRYEVKDMPDLTGKVAVVTGGSRGIGEALVGDLIQKGCHVHLLSSTKQHAEEAIEHYKEHTFNANQLITFHQVDLGTLKDVVSVTEKLANELDRLDLLFLIAGIGVAPFGLTNDGIGNHYGVNNLSQMVITDGLLDLLKKTSGLKNKGANNDEVEKFSTRIISESSELHRAAPGDVKCESLEEFCVERDAAILYNRSKLMNILFIRHLALHHLPSLTSTTPILAASVHPGGVATEQEKGAAQAYPILGSVLEAASKVLFMSREQGAESALWAGVGQSFAQRREECQGRYFTEADGKVDTETEQAKDLDLARRAWELGERVLKEKVGYVLKH